MRRLMGVVLLLVLGCSGRNLVRDQRLPSALETHFKNSAYTVEVRGEGGPLPAGAIDRWSITIDQPIRERLGSPLSGYVFKFMSASDARDFAWVKEGSGIDIARSGIYVLCLRWGFLGLHTFEHRGVKTPGLADAHARYAALQAAYAREPNNKVLKDKMLEALKAEEPLFNLEWGTVMTELRQVFHSFAE